MSLHDFTGYWKSSKLNTNPYQVIQGVPQRWVNRQTWYPGEGLILKGIIDDTLATEFKTRYEYPTPQQAPDRIPVIKFKFYFDNTQARPAADTNILRLIENAIYQLRGSHLVSTLIKVAGDEPVIETVEVLQSSRLPTGEPTDERKVMRHYQTWGDGMRAMWPCCFLSTLDQAPPNLQEYLP